MELFKSLPQVWLLCVLNSDEMILKLQPGNKTYLYINGFTCVLFFKALITVYGFAPC